MFHKIMNIGNQDKKFRKTKKTFCNRHPFNLNIPIQMFILQKTVPCIHSRYGIPALFNI